MNPMLMPGPPEFKMPFTCLSYSVCSVIYFSNTLIQIRKCWNDLVDIFKIKIVLGTWIPTSILHNKCIWKITCESRDELTVKWLQGFSSVSVDVSEVTLRSSMFCFVVCEGFSQITRVNDFQQQKEKENKKHYRRQFVSVWFLANNFIDSFPFFRQKTPW